MLPFGVSRLFWFRILSVEVQDMNFSQSTEVPQLAVLGVEESGSGWTFYFDLKKGMNRILSSKVNPLCMAIDALGPCFLAS